MLGNEYGKPLPFYLNFLLLVLFCCQVIIATPPVAKAPSAATAAVTRDAEAAVTGLVHVFTVCQPRQ